MATVAQVKPRSRVLGVIGYGIFLAVVLGMGSVAGWIGKSPVMWQLMLSKVGIHKAPEQVFGKNSLTLLILGCDEDQAPNWSRTAQGVKVLRKEARSDMMLVAKLDFSRNQISGVSIPRDMQCTLDGKTHKINAFHAIGGPELSKKAVEKLTGIPIDRVVVLDFDAFQSLVDMVGGVTVNVDKNLNYDDNAGNLHIHIQKGSQHLDGRRSMGFVRFRHSDDDFHRQARQKLFMLAFKDAVFGHAIDLPAIMEQAVRVMGGSLSDTDVATLVDFSQHVQASSIKMGVIPALNEDANPLRLDKQKLDLVLAQYGFAPASDLRASVRP